MQNADVTEEAEEEIGIIDPRLVCMLTVSVQLCWSPYSVLEESSQGLPEMSSP